MKSSLATLAIWAASSIVYGANAQETNNIAGTGASNCPEFIALSNGLEGSELEEFSFGVDQWAIGYLSGRNAELPETLQRDLTELTDGTLSEDLLEICIEEPNLTLYEIIDAFFEDAPPFMPLES